ncbi:MAG: TatD family hydrolase [Rhodospirillales bacterium]|nr:TatD family hydrolase [Rhodospirillales bacterium]
MLVDSHCHLNYPGLVEDLPGVLARAAAAGISHMVCICSRLSEFDAVNAIAIEHENIFSTIGVHPHDSDAEDPVTLGDLLARAAGPKVIGIGETGLDFFYDKSPRDAQEANFRVHIKAAQETGLPLIVHTRDADQRTIEILTEEAANGAIPGIIHCFTAGAEVAKTALDLGFYISLSGIITFANAGDLREIAKTLPLERILVETDAPFLAPVPMRGKRNEPAFVAHTADFVAKMFAIAPEELARTTTENFFSAFAKAEMR